LDYERSKNLYSFDELSEEVRKSLVEAQSFELGYDVMECYASDYEGTLKKFEELMGIKVNYSVDYCAYSFSFKFTTESYLMGDWNGETFYEDEICGKLLRRWLNREFLPYALPAKHFVNYDAGYNREKRHWNKQRWSKIQRESFDNCPLTGMCYDYDVLEPIIKRLSKPIPKNFSLKDMVNESLDALFSAWHKEYEYWCDNEDNCLEEEFRRRHEDELFFADGIIFNGTFDEADAA